MTIAKKGLALVAIPLLAQIILLITLLTQERSERLVLLGFIASAAFALGLGIFFYTQIIRRLRQLTTNATGIHDGLPPVPIGGDDELTEVDTAVREAGSMVARTTRRLRDHAVRLSLLNTAQAELMATGLDLPRMLDSLASSAKDLTGADGAVVEVAEGDEMVTRSAAGTAEGNLGVRVRSEGSISGLCFVTNRTVICDDSEQDSRANREACRRVGARSLVAVPLNQKTRPWGVLQITSHETGAFGPSVVDALELLSRSFSGALANASLYRMQTMEAEERTAELESLRQRFEGFMNNMPVLAYIKDFDGRYVYVNPAMHSAMSQRGVHEPLGVLAEDWMPRDVALEIQRQDREIIESDTPLQSAEASYVELPPSHFLLLRFPIIEKDGRRFLGGISVDVTDRIEAESEVRRLNEELEERVNMRTAELAAANRELEAFTYSVSHDLRAPLRAVHGYARMFEEDFGGSLTTEGARLLDVIKQNAELMGRLIDSLLRFSRLSRQPVNARSVDTTRMVDDIFRELVVESAAARPRLRLEPLPVVSADPTLLRQVFANLLSNAIKFSSRREEPLIEVASQAVDGEVVFQVRDNGAGFDMEYAHQLFGVFHRLHRHDEFEGTGVGLAIVQRIVMRHGGRVWAEGAPDQGATFYFSLPEAHG